MPSPSMPKRRGALALMLFSGAILAYTLWAQIAGGWPLWNSAEAEQQPREASAEVRPDDEFHQQIKPLLEQRCVVCHGCYDAPCQLKLEAREGLFRGAHPDPVYDGSRLLGAELTRLFEDAQSTAQWRERGFFPVLGESTNRDSERDGSVLAQMLLLKQQHPQPRDTLLPDAFDFSLNPQWHCPRADEFESFAQDNPLLGMPYALPELSEAEHRTLIDWIDRGAQAAAPPPIDDELQRQVDRWERFFNGDSDKQQLVNRYLYEHLFLANLYFEARTDTFFKLVRSRTPPGEPIERISTRRPFDDPKVDRVYYRLWRDPSSIVVKNHLPYALSSERMQRWQNWFLEPDYAVDRLPGYDEETSANPFATFVDLPVEARYRFLLDEAEFTIMNFIKGPVCRGQVALNVIQDHFWVTFVDPEHSAERLDADFLARHSEHLHMPASVGNTLRPVSTWQRYSTLQKEYLQAKARRWSNGSDGAEALNLDMIWDGDGHNSNAALTIFRHLDSASVHRGLVGVDPKTSWVIDYPLLERIHYLLVAGFDVYGNASHQLLTRMYMDFLRMEGEMNFVNFLPEASRKATMAHWYRDAEDDLEEYLSIYRENLALDTAVDYRTEHYQAELYQRWQQHLEPVLEGQHALAQLSLPTEAHQALQSLLAESGEHLSLLPPVTVLYLQEEQLITLVQHNAYSNLSSLFMEQQRRLPDEDSLTVTQGIIGNYPNSFMQLEVDDIPEFVSRLKAMASEDDYRALRDRYGVRRSDPDFWSLSDAIHTRYFEQEGVSAGWLDYNRLENR